MIAELATATAALPEMEPAAWRAHVVARVAAGLRPITLYGRAAGDDVLVTAVLADGYTLEAARARVVPQRGYHALTPDVPAVHVFERELHEQHGVHLPGHPWLKPLRYAGQDQAAMSAYPYYRVDGHEVHEVAVGPIHAGVIEPGAFRFACFGEQVLHLEIQLGYQHRGVEARLLERDPRRLAPWVETAAGDSSVAHAWAYAAALERLAGVTLDPAAALARATMLELERVAMHLATLSGLAADVGFLPGASTYGRLRTTAINTTMRLCGSRFGRGAVRPGRAGVALAEHAEALRAAIALLRADAAEIDAAFTSARTVRHRLADVGVVTRETARELGLVGPCARASGVPLDGRGGAGSYGARPVRVVSDEAGDCAARARVRIAEVHAALEWLAAVAAAPPEAPPPVTIDVLAPGQLAVTVVEGVRGEVVHCLETDAAGALVHYKVQDPSLRNWVGLALAVRGADISDFPICNKSFDLSYCGNDL